MELNTNISAHYGLLFVCEVIDLIHIKQMEFITQVAKVCFIWRNEAVQCLQQHI